MPCITASESNFSEPSVKKPKLEPKESEIEEIEVIDVPEIEVKIEHIENDYPTQALATPHCSKDKSQVSSGGFFGIFPKKSLNVTIIVIFRDLWLVSYHQASSQESESQTSETPGDEKPPINLETLQF